MDGGGQDRLAVHGVGARVGDEQQRVFQVGALLGADVDGQVGRLLERALDHAEGAARVAQDGDERLVVRVLLGRGRGCLGPRPCLWEGAASGRTGVRHGGVAYWRLAVLPHGVDFRLYRLGVDDRLVGLGVARRAAHVLVACRDARGRVSLAAGYHLVETGRELYGDGLVAVGAHL